MSEQIISDFPDRVDYRFLGGDGGSSTFYTLELRRGKSGWLVVIFWERQGFFRDSEGWSHPKEFDTATAAKRFFAGDGWRRLIELTDDRSTI